MEKRMNEVESDFTTAREVLDKHIDHEQAEIDERKKQMEQYLDEARLRDKQPVPCPRKYTEKNLPKCPDNCVEDNDSLEARMCSRFMTCWLADLAAKKSRVI